MNIGLLGLVFGRLGATSGVRGDPLAPAAPTLDLIAASDTGSSSIDNITSDTTPDIDFITAIAVVENDVLKIFDNGVQIVSHTVSAGEAGSSTLALGLSALSEGTHNLTATHTIAGPHTSHASNILTLVIDTTAPVLSSPTGTKTGSTTADISVSTNEGSGTLYYVVDQNLSTPSSTQIKAGQDQGGGAADVAANTTVSSSGVKTFNITGLTAATTYKAYFAQDDAAGNTSSAAASSSFTTDAAVGYVGPGDIVASANGWWGLRAYSAAAAGGQCVRLIRASDSTQQDFNTLANGSLDIASIVTFLALTTGKVVTIYDQSGGGLHLTQASSTLRPTFTLNAIGVLPAMQFTKSGPHGLTATGLASPPAQPFTVSFVAERNGDTTLFGDVFATAGGNVQIGFGNAVNTVAEFAGSIVTAAAADNAFHAVQAIMNGASSDLVVEGSSNTVSPGTLATSAAIGIGFPNGGGGNALTGLVMEVGLWTGAFSAGNKTAMNTNQHTFYGF